MCRCVQQVHGWCRLRGSEAKRVPYSYKIAALVPLPGVLSLWNSHGQRIHFTAALTKSRSHLTARFSPTIDWWTNRQLFMSQKETSFDRDWSTGRKVAFSCPCDFESLFLLCIKRPKAPFTLGMRFVCCNTVCRLLWALPYNTRNACTNQNGGHEIQIWLTEPKTNLFDLFLKLLL